MRRALVKAPFLLLSLARNCRGSGQGDTVWVSVLSQSRVSTRRGISPPVKCRGETETFPFPSVVNFIVNVAGRSFSNQNRTTAIWLCSALLHLWTLIRVVLLFLLVFGIAFKLVVATAGATVRTWRQASLRGTAKIMVVKRKSKSGSCGRKGGPDGRARDAMCEGPEVLKRDALKLWAELGELNMELELSALADVPLEFWQQ